MNTLSVRRSDAIRILCCVTQPRASPQADGSLGIGQLRHQRRRPALPDAEVRGTDDLTVRHIRWRTRKDEAPEVEHVDRVADVHDH